jgi:hypothetical protein
MGAIDPKCTLYLPSPFHLPISAPGFPETARHRQGSLGSSARSEGGAHQSKIPVPVSGVAIPSCIGLYRTSGGAPGESQDGRRMFHHKERVIGRPLEHRRAATLLELRGRAVTMVNGTGPGQ